MQVKVENPDLIPFRANLTDAGLDLKSSSEVWLEKGKRTLVKTGVSVKIPPNHVGLLFPRSSLSKNNIVMTNSVGVIDSDYRGEIMASLMYIGDEWDTCILKNERIVQLVVVPIILPTLEINNYSDDEWFDTQRGAGGFGSTGKA